MVSIEFNGKIIITNNLLDWLDYEGRNFSDKKVNFLKFLIRNKINYTNVSYTEQLIINYEALGFFSYIDEYKMIY